MCLEYIDLYIFLYGKWFNYFPQLEFWNLKI